MLLAKSHRDKLPQWRSVKERGKVIYASWLMPLKFEFKQHTTKSQYCDYIQGMYDGNG